MVPIQLPQRTQDLLHQLVDYGLAQTSCNRRGMPPVTALMRCVREEVLSPTTAGKYTQNTGRLDLT
jgi:hypothetical protein